MSPNHENEKATVSNQDVINLIMEIEKMGSFLEVSTAATCVDAVRTMNNEKLTEANIDLRRSDARKQMAEQTAMFIGEWWREIYKREIEKKKKAGAPKK